MITCPNCGQEAADESLHCGHCGHQLQSGGMKTMFGMAALDPATMQQAAAEAKAARAAAEDAANSADAPTTALPATAPKNIPAPSIPKPGNFNIPTPDQGGSLAEESSSVFDLPKPGNSADAATINTPSIGFPDSPVQTTPASTPQTPQPSDQPGWANVGGSADTGNSDPAWANVGGSEAPAPSGDPAWAGSSNIDTKPNPNVGGKSEPTFDMTPGPTGGALKKSGPPVALIAAVGVAVLLVLCIISAAVGMMFL